MGTGIGFRKVILFNEHFVVYGIPAIASSIDSKIKATVERANEALLEGFRGSGFLVGDGWALEDVRLNALNRSTDDFLEPGPVLRIFDAANFDPTEKNIKITIEGELETTGGIGSSAAFCVSITRALNQEFDLGLKAQDINEIAYEAEKAYAGTPSGIDNTVSTFGGMIYFAKNLQGGDNTVERLSVREPMPMVMGNTGIRGRTKTAVAGVRRRKERNEERYSRIFLRAEELIESAVKSLRDHDLDAVGDLMYANHGLLQEIGVSHPKLDHLVEIARREGAKGAKMTGGGLGGHMIALTPEPEVRDRVVGAMRKSGYEAIPTLIGVSSSNDDD